MYVGTRSTKIISLIWLQSKARCNSASPFKCSHKVTHFSICCKRLSLHVVVLRWNILEIHTVWVANDRKYGIEIKRNSTCCKIVISQQIWTRIKRQVEWIVAVLTIYTALKLIHVKAANLLLDCIEGLLGRQASRSPQHLKVERFSTWVVFAHRA